MSSKLSSFNEVFLAGNGKTSASLLLLFYETDSLDSSTFDSSFYGTGLFYDLIAASNGETLGYFDIDGLTFMLIFGFLD